MPRGSSWSEDEIISLTLAFLEVSEDPTVGTERKSEDFWEEITKKFQTIYAGRKGVSAADCLEAAASRTSAGKYDYFLI